MVDDDVVTESRINDKTIIYRQWVKSTTTEDLSCEICDPKRKVKTTSKIDDSGESIM